MKFNDSDLKCCNIFNEYGYVKTILIETGEEIKFNDGTKK